MAITRFRQAPLDKANEVFDKLLATSNNAVKTRERLFVDLKEELEPLATLQDEHLFPVLTLHGMHDRLREAESAIGKQYTVTGKSLDRDRQPPGSFSSHTLEDARGRALELAKAVNVPIIYLSSGIARTET